MYHAILHPTDLSERHFHLAEKALAISNCFHAPLYLLHVIEPPPTLQLAQGLGFAEFDHPLKDDAIMVMKTLGDALNIPPERQFIEIGSIKMQVIQKADELHCNLIILGSHTPGKIPAFLEGTASAILHKAHGDVMTLRV